MPTYINQRSVTLSGSYYCKITLIKLINLRTIKAIPCNENTIKLHKSKYMYSVSMVRSNRNQSLNNYVPHIYTFMLFSQIISSLFMFMFIVAICFDNRIHCSVHFSIWTSSKQLIFHVIAFGTVKCIDDWMGWRKSVSPASYTSGSGLHFPWSRLDTQVSPNEQHIYIVK